MVRIQITAHVYFTSYAQIQKFQIPYASVRNLTDVYGNVYGIYGQGRIQEVQDHRNMVGVEIEETQNYRNKSNSVVKQDTIKALKWYEKAAEQGHPKAQTNLGAMYYSSQSVEQDYTKAYKWTRKAAEQGDAIAQLNLGVMYFKGEGVSQDYVWAYTWVSLAAVGVNLQARII